MIGVEQKENIIVYNATENNLKNLTVAFPLNRFTCVTGPSGCGKSSLVFDTIYAESQRNFLESMTGNLFGQKLMDKPKVDRIENLRPALNISQNYYNVNPRSTVGTITDISYYLRTLYAFIINATTGSHWDMNHFSPNNPSVCCPKCNGMGEEYIISEQALIPDQSKKLSAGGILYYKGNKTSQEYKLLEAICTQYGIDINKRVCDLTDTEKYNLLYRNEPETFHIKFKTPKGRYKTWTVKEKGAMAELEGKLKGIDLPSTFNSIAKYLAKKPCSVCAGQKVNENIRSLKICGANIGEAEQFSIPELLNWCASVRKEYKENQLEDHVLNLLAEIEKRSWHLRNLQLDYISIGRNVPSLSGGELQRVRMATQLECSLSGLIYILDEPCKGLHFKNIDSVIDATKAITKKGNTVIAIEHNKQYISSAEHIIKMGPVGGPNGGYITEEIPGSLQYDYRIHLKEPRDYKKVVKIQGISYHNLKNIDISIPVGVVTCLTGVSGSGKSSVTDILEEAISRGESERCKKISGESAVKKVLRVNQRPIGKTARSTVISYLGIYDDIKNVFAETEAAKEKGLSTSDFGMNNEGGRCECCQGTGKRKIELTYLPESYIVCPECNGKRFHEDVLSVTYKGLTIDDVLDGSIDSLIPIFEDKPAIVSMLSCMVEIGLGYISLGQMSMNLSGGEAQRIKLAKYLGLNSKGNNLYILDEPTSGLNEKDIGLLSNIVNRLADNGETIVVIEHNIEFISGIADYMIDLGNIAGNAGGTTVIEGKPETVLRCPQSSWYGIEHISEN